jgi:Raf kinase inhibitor-like YbhB/YbcL family protein
MKVTSPSFEYGRRIPARHTCDGEGTSPALQITDLPPGTVSLTLIAEDPDAPGGTWDHWVVFDLPPAGDIPEGAEGTGVPGLNSWRRVGYGAPCPPSGIHRYLFRVTALADTLRLPERSSRRAVEEAMEGKVLGEAVLMGRYGN